MSQAEVDALRTEVERARAVAAAAERRAQASTAVARALIDARAEDDAVPRVLEATGTALGATLAAYWLPAGDALECRATWRSPGTQGSWDEACRARRIGPGDGAAGRAWRERDAVQLAGPPAALDEARAEVLARAEVATAVAFPVIAGGELQGVVELFGREGALGGAGPGVDATLAEALRAIGAHVGQFVRYVRERDASLRMHDLGRSLAGVLDQQALAQAVADVAIQVTGAAHGAMFYRAAQSETEELRCAVSGPAREAFAKLPLPRTTPLLGPTFNGRAPIRSDDVTLDPRYGKNPPHRGFPDGHLAMKSYLAVPVRSREGRMIGALFLGHERAGVFDDRAQRLAVGLATHAATAMDNAALFANQQRLIEALEKTNAELDQFAYAASHDLRAPLRGISSLAGWIEEDLGSIAPKKVRDHIAMLKGRASRMDRLIAGLLELARVGRARQKAERVDTTALIHETIDLLNPPPASRILIIGAMPTLTAERAALQQVFLNLIANALQHARKSDVVVRITSIDRPDEVEFSVADDGVGVPAELQAQCWELFQTLQSRDIVESTGIGLTIVRKQVEATGGKAWFVPHPKVGADVRFTWPKRAK